MSASLITFESAAAFGLAATADLLSRGFSDYVIPLSFSPLRLLEMVRGDSVDLAASRIVRQAGEPVGVALIARRGWTSRLAAMALVPEARRRGLGRSLMEHVLAESRARGDRALVLEVIEQNDPALGLYLACGFRKMRRLVGFLGHAAGRPPAVTLADVDLRTVAQAIARHGATDLPWQLSAETIAQLTPPSRACWTPGAWLAFSPATETQMAVRALVSSAPDDANGAARTLLAAVMTRHPGKSWRMTAVWPEEQAALFADLSFDRLNLTQWQMRQDLAPADSPASPAA